jgi:hypothetical protein
VGLPFPVISPANAALPLAPTSPIAHTVVTIAFRSMFSPLLVRSTLHFRAWTISLGPQPQPLVPLMLSRSANVADEGYAPPSCLAKRTVDVMRRSSSGLSPSGAIDTDLPFGIA